MRTIQFCPSTLADGVTSYSPVAVRNLFGGKRVSPYLDFSFEEDGSQDELAENMQNLSISGAQEKYGAVLRDGKICLAADDEQSTHILKPAPIDKISYRKQIPCNEHLTMQLASQVYGIQTAACGLCFAADGQPVYITRRFDVLPDGIKLMQEDFCSIVGRNEQEHGVEFKYNGSYEDIANAIKRTIPAWPVAMERFFRLIVFNYIYANGDAHLKNFSVLYQGADVQLAPAYDLINTEMHIHSTDLGLSEGLSSVLPHSDAYERTGHLCEWDFREFGRHVGLNDKRIESVLSAFRAFPPLVQTLIDRSYFFDDSMRRNYHRIIEERRRRFIRVE